MEMCYLNRGTDKYIQIDIGDNNYLQEFGYMYQIRMLESNNVKGFIRPAVIEMDNKIYLKYTITALYVMEKYLREIKVTGIRLFGWIKQIIECIEDMEKYLLQPDNIVLSPEYMFLEHQSEALSFIYATGYNKNIILQIKSFLEYCMQCFDVSDRHGIQFLYKLHAVMSEDGCSIYEIKNILSSYEMNDMHVMEEDEKGKDISADEDRKYIIDKDDKGIVRCISPIRLIILGINLCVSIYLLYMYIREREQKLFLYVTILTFVVFVIHLIVCLYEPEENIDEIMSEYEQQLKVDEKKEICDIKRLIPLGGGVMEDIDFNKVDMPCIIGRGKKDTTYRLRATQISRIHACIYDEGGFYYLEDRGSTNGTFVNSERICAFERIKLNRGDVISFANEDFFVT